MPVPDYENTLIGQYIKALENPRSIRLKGGKWGHRKNRPFRYGNERTMKKYWALLLDWILKHLICFKTSFGFYYRYKKEIHNTYIEPITKRVKDSDGEYKYDIVWPSPPKWYKNWMRKAESCIAEIIYEYLQRNKNILKKITLFHIPFKDSRPLRSCCFNLC